MSAKLPRMTAAPMIGNTVVPKELKAWAKVRRLCVVDGGPSRLMSGLATTCTITTPLARMNSAPRKMG